MFPKCLSNLQLRHALLTNGVTKEKFNYVTSADLLKHVEECPSMIIVNTGCYTGKGEHWLLMYFPDTTTIEIYDSLCNDISCYPQDIRQFITKFKTIQLSKGTKHPVNSLLCGYYCLYDAHMRCQGIDMMKRNDNFMWIKHYVERHFTIPYFT